ncbi:MAG: AsmA family protein [Proteobacteria bacterium]|nr:AsmA family protein [Pseudomonadota bacterium]
MARLRTHLKLARFFWWTAAAAAAALLSVIIIPPMINLDRLKPGLETSVLNQTGMHIKINGRVRISLLGRATISAHDITVAEYAGANHIDTVSFRVPIAKIFSLSTAPIPASISIYGADLDIASLSPPALNSQLIIENSAIHFMGKTYGDINGRLKDGLFSGTVRTDQHKYTFDLAGREFVIRNPNVNLTITGTLATDSAGNVSAAGTLAIETDKINRWFAFDVPALNSSVAVSMKYEWNGGDDFRFYDISGTTGGAAFSGEIKLSGARRSVRLRADNLNYDMTFLLQNAGVLRNSDLDLDLSGRLSFMDRTFNKFRLKSTGAADRVLIDGLNVMGGGISALVSGEITGRGTRLSARILKDGADIYCEFEGDATNWACNNFTFSSREFAAAGSLSVLPLEYALRIRSGNPEPALAQLKALRDYFGDRIGYIEFAFPDTTGVAEISGDDYTISFSKKNTFLDAMPAKHPIFDVLPASMRTAVGAIQSAEIKNGALVAFGFLRNGRDAWSIGVARDGAFRMTANLIDFLRAYYPGLDTKFLKNNIPMAVSGVYRPPYASGLNITFFDDGRAAISGKYDGRAFDLRADVLDIDSFINASYVQNYDSEQFVTAEPLTVPFALGISATLSANRLRYNGEEYANFVYAIKDNSQQMSITDKARGSILFALDKRGSRYSALLQANRFGIAGNILQNNAGLNLGDTMITAQAELETSGVTAHDFWANMSGGLDLAFDGGILSGLGIDQFYAGADSVTRATMGDAVATMLTGGRTQIKSMHIIGKYDAGNFETVRPFALRVAHSDIAGMLKIAGGKLAAQLNITLRGTSPMPEPIRLSIAPDGSRDYSLFEISSKIDPDFLNEFMATHERF